MARAKPTKLDKDRKFGVPTPTKAAGSRVRPEDLGSGQASRVGKKAQTRDQKNTVAGVRAKKALGTPLTEKEQMILRRANQATDDSQ